MSAAAAAAALTTVKGPTEIEKGPNELEGTQSHSNDKSRRGNNHDCARVVFVSLATPILISFSLELLVSLLPGVIISFYKIVSVEHETENIPRLVHSKAPSFDTSHSLELWLFINLFVIPYVFKFTILA